ncbi:MAG: hypothetical protein M1598_01905 [Actinobacteria bacterium]|nr:hypothetical protein [Actinomycetota bacterium]
MAVETIKSLAVIGDVTVQKVAEYTIAAPTGVTVDPTTGALSLAVTVQVTGSPVLNATVLTDKVVNYGFVPASITVAGTPTPIALYLPIQQETDIPGVLPGDDVEEFPTLEGALVYGYPTTAIGTLPAGNNLVIKAVFKVRIVVSRLSLVSVQTQPCTSNLGPITPPTV